MIENELRKPVEKNEHIFKIIKDGVFRMLNSQAKCFKLDEREKAIISCQVVKELQKEVLETYKRLK